MTGKKKMVEKATFAWTASLALSAFEVPFQQIGMMEGEKSCHSIFEVNKREAKISDWTIVWSSIPRQGTTVQSQCYWSNKHIF